jgi:succinate dehydrogenase/fumarate reductase flavoprotein subunit
LAAANEREEANTSIRLAAMSCIKEMTSATIFGEKRAAFCGKKKINDMNHQIQFVVEKVKELKREYGEQEYAKKHKQLKEAMAKTFTVERKKEAKESLKSVLTQQHIPSAKELVSGIDYSPMMLDLIQFGKIFLKIKGVNTRNLEVLQTEWKG